MMMFKRMYQLCLKDVISFHTLVHSSSPGVENPNMSKVKGRVKRYVFSVA